MDHCEELRQREKAGKKRLQDLRNELVSFLEELEAPMEVVLSRRHKLERISRELGVQYKDYAHTRHVLKQDYGVPFVGLSLEDFGSRVEQAESAEDLMATLVKLASVVRKGNARINYS